MIRPNEADPLDDIGVVIVTYNSAQDISECIQRLPIHRLRAVIVIDNASHDRTIDIVRADFPSVLIHSNDRNLGFGLGCNLGALLLTGASRVLFLNPDARIAAGGMVKLASYMDRNPGCALTAPLLWKDGEPIPSASEVATFWTELREALPRRLRQHIADRRHDPAFDRSGPVGAVEGACMLVDDHAFRSAGMFDPRFFLFFEEHDLARRLRRIGRTTDLCASASATHSVGAARASLPDRARAELVTSTVRYLRKWSGRVGALAYVGVAGTSAVGALLARAIPASTARMQLSALAAGLRRGRSYE